MSNSYGIIRNMIHIVIIRIPSTPRMEDGKYDDLMQQEVQDDP